MKWSLLIYFRRNTWKSNIYKIDLIGIIVFKWQVNGSLHCDLLHLCYISSSHMNILMPHFLFINICMQIWVTQPYIISSLYTARQYYNTCRQIQCTTRCFGADCVSSEADKLLSPVYSWRCAHVLTSNALMSAQSRLL